MCGRMYKHHYVDRLRAGGGSSALFFGVAIDEALNALLLKTGNPFDVFKEHFTYEMCKGTNWFAADFDTEVLTEEQINSLSGKTREYVTWACMRVKGRLLLEKYIADIYPLIEEVHDVQLETGRPGFIDAVVTLRGYGKVLLDHKTSSRFYKRDSVKSSGQLALYAGQTGIKQQGFCVLSKTINKGKIKTCKVCGHKTTTSHSTCNSTAAGPRCHGEFSVSVNPQAVIQLIVDKIEESEKVIIEQSMVETEAAIAAGVFPKNAGQCHTVFGKKCQYFNLCRTGDKTGLEIAKERKKK